MTSQTRRRPTTAVIGAGPYGLSTAAHLHGLGVPTRVFGEPMESWRKMPRRMYLKSVWSASSLSDPGGAHNLDRYCATKRATAHEPIPLDFFIEYATWFQENAVPNVERARVVQLSRQDGEFVVKLSDGSELAFHNVVVAVGIRQFSFVPEFARGLPAHLASHTDAHVDYSGFRGCRVVVIGSGQSALECAAILNDESAAVEIIARGPVHWIRRAFYDRGGPVRHLLYPPTDVGPPVLNWLCASPLLMSRLPDGFRRKVETRAVRPAGANWLRKRVDGKVPITPHTQVLAAQPSGGGVRLYLGDGTIRDADHLLLGTGYRPDLHQLEFLDRSLLADVRDCDGFPVLNQWFETSVPGLHFVGGLAGRTFGPICRFVAGARVTAEQVARKAASQLN